MALFASGAGENKIDTQRYELWFGAAPVSPIAMPVPCPIPTAGHQLCHRIEPDYVPNYETVVPQVIQSCGASFGGFRAMTEGKMGAYFIPDPSRTGEVVRCIKRRLPQGFVQAPVNAPL